MLGISPTLVRALIPHGEPQTDLSSLRTIVTTGEPWNPDPYRWLFEHVGGGRTPIINCSGGTEVGACFLSCCVAEPIKACSLGGPATGMAVDVVDGDWQTADVIVHDPTNKAVAHMLIDMPIGSFPMALGVIYADPRATFESAVLDQNAQAAAGRFATPDARELRCRSRFSLAKSQLTRCPRNAAI